MAVTQYIGARYVPLFADPAEWSANNQYEPLTIVTYQGASYTSKQAVPTGIDITNADYWALTGNYNAQVEQYRQEVRQFDGRITENAEAIDSEADARAQADTALGTRITNEASVRESADTALGTRITNEASARESADTALGTRITNEANARESADTALGTRITNEANARESADTRLGNRITALENATDEPHLIVIGDSWSVASTGLVSQLASSMGVKTANVHNYAMGGTGFLRDYGTNFVTQLSNAIAATSVPKNKMTYLAIIGGTNDYNAGFYTASQYITVINNMLSSARSAFVNIKPVVFFMQHALNRTYPFKLIKDVKAGVNGQVINFAAPFATSLFTDNLHLTQAGYKKAAKFIASCFGFGTPDSYASEAPVDITETMNTALGTTKVQNANFRETWTENEWTLYIYTYYTEALTANELNGFLNNLSFESPVAANQRYIDMRLYSLGQADTINVSAGNKQIGFRNIAALPRQTYIGSGSFVWN